MVSFEKKSKILKRITRRIIDDFGVIPWVATEIEFYILGFEEIEQISGELMYALASDLKASGLNYIKVEKERGKSQYEVALHHVPSSLESADATVTLKDVIRKTAEEICLEADFSAKPLKDDFGSGFHIHISLHDKAGHNFFCKEDENRYSDMLLHSAGGMLATMKDFMVFFAPHAKSYSRFEPKMNVPVAVSWGTNNRTTALRLPSSTDITRHIEHRVSGIDADPHLAIAAVLAGVHYGLANKISPPEQIFGDASLSMYNLETLPQSIDESRRLFKESRVAQEYFPEFFQA